MKFMGGFWKYKRPRTFAQVLATSAHTRISFNAQRAALPNAMQLLTCFHSSPGDLVICDSKRFDLLRSDLIGMILADLMMV